MKKQLAFVLGGGGARGALQAGALKALYEAGLRPDLLVGTSIGAVNAAFLALHGFNMPSVEKLAVVWRKASTADLLPANYLWLTVRNFFGRPSSYSAQRIRDFFIRQGLAPEIRFADIRHVRLILVASDLNRGQPVLYGQNEEDSILEAVLASATLPPWVTPFEKDGRYLMDGGTVSNLPIEPALSVGATEIIALDLLDPRDVQEEDYGFGPFLGRLIYTVEKRQQDLEIALALARGVPATHIHLQGKNSYPLWDFQHTEELLAMGYEITKNEIKKRRSLSWTDRFRGWWKNSD